MHLIIALLALLATSSAPTQPAPGSVGCKWRLRVLASATDSKVLATATGPADSLTLVGAQNNRVAALRLPPNILSSLEQRSGPIQGRVLEISVGDSVVRRATLTGATFPSLLPVAEASAIRGSQKLRGCLQAAAKP